MQVTEVRVFPVDEDKLRAYVTITLDHCFVIRDLKIIHGATGYFVSMPSKKRKDGTYKDIAHPINNETRRMIEEKIIAEYQKVLAEGGVAAGGIREQVDAIAEYRGPGGLQPPPGPLPHGGVVGGQAEDQYQPGDPRVLRQHIQFDSLGPVTNLAARGRRWGSW